MIPSWVVVEQDICRKEFASFLDDDPTTAEARASNGELVRVSFLLSSLPDASRFCVHCPPGRELSYFDVVLAAHGDAVLFRLEIDDHEGRLPASPSDFTRSGGSAPSDFTITISTLMHRGDNDLGWEEDATIGDEQLWDMVGYSDQLPRVPPQFPLVSMDDPNVIYFVLRDGHKFGAGAKAWMVALGMDRSKVLWYKLIKASDDENAETNPYNIFCCLPFLPTEFSKHLRKAAPK
ncbi:hypothetical protein HU200_024866 [Digitaria exilis]|uniref:DUF1618 domain-containing protein n=1 Tax=Digitaria exilis TaxID=1010633 RepID=A0A835C3Y8_9POAL|nr:hypothetical protein HU200_024866 [Digitaria exilis]